jgi:type VI secretion system protein ImpL
VADPGVGGCMSKFVGQPSGNGADDYFAVLRSRLYGSLLDRCSQSYVYALRQQWEGFSAAFNQDVAGRAPFGGAGIVSASAADAGSADFGELGQVLKRYQRASVTFRDAGAGAGPRAVANTASVRQFIDNFDQVRTLLAPLYPSDDGAPTGYDVSVDFRANRAGEIAANQVIDWTLSIGAQSLSLGDAPHPLHWDYGTPVTLVLRFAKDSPLTALNDPQQHALSTDGRTLTWQFADPWALISFIARQRVPDSSLRGDSAAQLLRFEFPLGTASPADLGLLPKQARGRVFLRVALMPAGKKIPLPWPGSFPARAPDWTSL